HIENYSLSYTKENAGGDHTSASLNEWEVETRRPTRRAPRRVACLGASTGALRP
ncbi:hypothetical protein HAX54_015069, partial [Datura stramonium]|nr:hypothetical protein [Datura stramonium]